jgi:hypothetical protein
LYTLQASNVEVVGKFNPFVVSPVWMLKQSIWRPDEIEIRGTFPADQGGGLRFRGGHIEVEATQEHLQIENSGFDVECAEIAKKVMELLPHTPVRECTASFVYYDPDDTGSGLAQILQEQAPADPGHEILYWGMVSSLEGGAQAETRVAVGGSGSTVHFSISRSAGDASQVVESLRLYQTDFDWCGRTMQKLGMIVAAESSAS